MTFLFNHYSLWNICCVKKRNSKSVKEDQNFIAIIKYPVFWSVLLAVISGAFALGHYFGKDRYNREIIEYLGENRVLRLENSQLRLMYDSLVIICPPMDPISCEIISPNEQALIATPDNVSVSGVIKNLPADTHLWLVVRPEFSNGWWPQIAEIIPKPTGEWKGIAKLSGNTKGNKFEIHLVMTNKFANPLFIADKSLNNSLPDGAKSLQFITVIKNK